MNSDWVGSISTDSCWSAMFLDCRKTMGKLILSTRGIFVRKSCLLILLLAGGIVASTEVVIGQAARDELSKKKTTNCTFEISATNRTNSGLLVTPQSASLGFLEANESCKVLMTIENRSDQPIKFDKFRTSCQCSGFMVSEYEIRPGRSIHAELTWDVPGSSEVTDIGTSVLLMLDGTDILEFRFQAKLANNIFVGDTGFGTRTKDGFTHWRLPILVSAPVKLSELKAVLSDEMRGFTTEIVAGEEQPEGIERGFVLINSHEKIEGGEYTFGALKLIHPSNPVVCEKSLTLQCKLPVTLSPLVLGFQKKDDVYVANAMVQIDASALNAAELGAIREKLSISCSVDGRSLATTVKALNASIFRVTVSISEARKAELNAESSADWDVRFNGLSFDMKSRVSFR